MYTHVLHELCMYSCIFFMAIFFNDYSLFIEIAIIHSFMYNFREFHDNTYLQRELYTVIILEHLKYTLTYASMQLNLHSKH